jgi:hypothetical protein
MDIGFDEALRVARRCIADRTGDHEAAVIGYEKGEDHYFQFHTVKGDRGVVVDKRGVTRHCFAEDRDEASGGGGDVTKGDAVDKALCFLGDGRVERVRVKDEGYEVDVDRGDEGTFRVFVDREGMVHGQKCSRLSRNLAADIE